MLLFSFNNCIGLKVYQVTKTRTLITGSKPFWLSGSYINTKCDLVIEEAVGTGQGGAKCMDGAGQIATAAKLHLGMAPHGIHLVSDAAQG